MDSLERLLDVVRRELEADDARIEIGGREPDDQRVVWGRLPQGWRVVALFDQTPESRAGCQQRLETLLQAFRDVGRRAPRPRGDVSPSRTLDDALADLAARTGADHAIIIDESSPVVWGSSDLERNDEQDVDQLRQDAAIAHQGDEAALDLGTLIQETMPEATKRLRDSGIARTSADRLLREARRLSERDGTRDAESWQRHFRLARAVDALRSGSGREVRGERLGYLARALGGIYRLVLVFDGPFSELHAEAAAIHAAPYLERLLAALPPFDPGSGHGGGREANVIRLPRRG